MFKELNARSIILLIILVGVIIYALISSGIIGSGEGDVENLFGLASKTSSGSASATKQLSGTRPTAPLQAVIWTKSWESDPFFYAEAETTNALGGGVLGALLGSMDRGDRPTLTLTGISWNGNVGMALINGDILGEGDRVAGYQVTKIAFDHVILRRGTSIVKVRLND